MLIPSVPPTATPADTCRTIHAALTSAKLGGMMSYWPTGHMELNQTAYVDEDKHSSPLMFVERLKEMAKQEGIAELRLNGEISLSETGDAPILLRIRFNEGILSYQQAVGTWGETVTS
jgi:hypothetical protein